MILFAATAVLYGFTRDRRGGPSQCYGDCAAAWPVYYAPGVLTAGLGVRWTLLGTIKRPDADAKSRTTAGRSTTTHTREPVRSSARM